MSIWKLLSSVATAAGQRHFSGFPAMGAIVETVRAKADILLPRADGAVLFTGEAIFRQVALRTKRRTLHKGVSRKLYLSMGGCGKVKVGTMRESLNSYLECTQFLITLPGVSTSGAKYPTHCIDLCDLGGDAISWAG